MYQGKIVEYIDQGKILCTICLQDKGNRLHLLTTTNREVNLSPKRALLITETTIGTLSPREEMLEKLINTEAERTRLKAQIDVKELWELLKDEKQSYDHRYLAQLAFGETITPDHMSALVRALFENRLHFKMKDGRFVPHTEERIEQITRQRHEEALKEELLNKGSEWLKALRSGENPDPPACGDEITGLLIQMALFGKDLPEFKYGKELLLRAGISDLGETRNLLIRMGVWQQDENLDILRFGINTGFNPTQRKEAERLAGAQIRVEGREDLRDLHALTIDGPLTLEYDDALSLEIDGDTLLVGVHIADVAAVIRPGSILDREARERTSSLYLPRRQIPMIPPELSQEGLSLRQGCDRQAISLLTRFDRAGNLLDQRFVSSVIRVHERLTYEEVNTMLNEEGPFRELERLSLQLRQKRMNQGAVSLSLPELEFVFGEDSAISLKLSDQDTPSRIIVAELMILYNWLAARLCRDEHIPVLYRTQAEPAQLISPGDSGHLFYVFSQRRKLSPLRLDTEPGPHSGLGLDAYAQSTSPLRRYLDLVTQRQISSFLTGLDPVCDGDALEDVRISVEPGLKSLETIKRNRIRYWTVKFLAQNPGGHYTAVVIDELKRKYRITLKDLYLVTEIRKRPGFIFNPGEEISVVVKKADPWNDLVDIEHEDEIRP